MIPNINCQVENRKHTLFRKVVPVCHILNHRQCHDKKCTFAVCGVWIICLISFKCLVEHNRYLETLTQE